MHAEAMKEWAQQGRAVFRSPCIYRSDTPNMGCMVLGAIVCQCVCVSLMSGSKGYSCEFGSVVLICLGLVVDLGKEQEKNSSLLTWTRTALQARRPGDTEGSNMEVSILSSFPVV